MKATELMIGDWAIFNGNPLKVQAIDSRDSEIVAEDGIFCTEESRWAYTADKVEGVPLTPEILEKNGFCFVKSSDRDSVWNGWWIYKDLELGTCCLNREDNWPCYINITDSNVPCEYVHQVQHALRLCGLNEVADNFKI